MLVVIARPLDRTATVAMGAPPAPFGISGFGPNRSVTLFTGVETRVVFADDTYIGDPADLGGAGDRAVALHTPPTPFGAGVGATAGGFGPARSFAVIWPAASLPSSEDLANIYFPPRLKSSFNFETKLFDGDEPNGRSRPGFGEMTILNTDGRFDDALVYAWDGRSVEIFEGDKRDAFYPGFTRRFIGTTEGLQWDESTINIRLRDPQLRCDRRVQQSAYTGTGLIEGDAALKGRLKPEAFGYLENVPCLLINAAGLIYQVHTRQIQSVLAVRDKGAALSYDADYATYALLAAASIPAGRYATSLAYGLVRLASAPAGQVTADIEGDSGPSGIGGDYVNDTSGILRRVATAFLPEVDRFGDPDEIDSAAFAAVYALQPAEVGYFCDAGETAAEMFDRLMAAMGGAWSVTLLGQLAVRRLDAPSGSPAATLAPRHILGTRRRGTVPSWRRRIGYRRMWLVQSKDDLAGSVTEANRALYSEQYRWALAIDESARDAHRRARDVELAGFYRYSADADAEAARQQELFGTLRHIYTVPVQGLGTFARNLGEVVGVTGWDRFGWGDPESFVLVGLQADVARGELVYELWN